MPPPYAPIDKRRFNLSRVGGRADTESDTANEPAAGPGQEVDGGSDDLAAPEAGRRDGAGQLPDRAHTISAVPVSLADDDV